MECRGTRRRETFTIWLPRTGDERDLAVGHLIGTMEIANDLEVDRVVVHGGFNEGLDREVSDLREVRDLGLSDVRMTETRDRLLDKRRRNSSRFLDRLLKSIDECTRTAERLGVTLCMENRSDPHQLPDLEEMWRVFEVFEGAPVGFWLDLGHTVRQERLGLCDVEDWLKFSRRNAEGHPCARLQGILGPSASRTGRRGPDPVSLPC